VLAGAKKLLTTSSPVVLLALHGPEAESCCRAFLKEVGYECFHLDGSPAVETPFREEEILARRVTPGRAPVNA
jgi:hypothetical protein